MCVYLYINVIDVSNPLLFITIRQIQQKEEKEQNKNR